MKWIKKTFVYRVWWWAHYFNRAQHIYANSTYWQGYRKRGVLCHKKKKNHFYQLKTWVRFAREA